MDQTSGQEGGAGLEIQSVTETSGNTPLTETPAAEGQSPTLMGVLAYIGPLVLIPFFIARDDSFVKFHVRQGVLLLIVGLILWVLDEMFLRGILSPIIALLQVGILILSIIGIINVIQKKEKALPFVGGYADHIKV